MSVITNTSGRRKEATASIFLKEGNGNIIINKKDYKQYFPTLPLQYIVNQALGVAEAVNKYDINVNVKGGGVTGQAEAIRLAIAKALVALNPEVKPLLRAQGLMTRDSRIVERKKPGRKKARRKFQFSKR